MLATELRLNFIQPARSDGVQQFGEVPADQLARSLALLHMHESIPESWHMFTSLPGKQYVEFAEKIYRSARRQAQRSTRSTP